MIGRLAAIALLLASSLATANEQALQAMAASAGTWEGELYYLDYQSGQRFDIPMQAVVEATPDGATVIRRLTWTDPGNLVHAVVLSTVDRDSGELVEAFFREGNAEFMRYEFSAVDIESDEKWSVSFEHDGTDDGRPARIRHKTERDGDAMTSRKSVRFLDDESTEFFERNGTELRLVEIAEQ